MSSFVKNSVTKEDNAIVTKSNRKSKKRNHRNRFRNSCIRKKKLKKLLSTHKTDFRKPNISRFKLNCEKIMSNWYWSNYQKALEWQEKHKIAHWKACALALSEENKYLIQIINSMHSGLHPEISVTYQNLCDEVNYNNKSLRQTSSVNFMCFKQNHCDNVDYEKKEDDAAEGADNYNCNSDEEVSDDIEFEMSEEMIQFFEQSYKQKMYLKNMQEKELLSNAEQEVKDIQSNKLKRVAEMKILYGEGASMITGMETAVQLSFDKYCDTKTPKYWPNIPFRL